MEFFNGLLGTSVSGAGDVNLDGYADIVAGAPGYSLDPDGTWRTGDEMYSAGRVYVYSGKDSTTLWTFDGETFANQLGGSVSDAGDVNLDGAPDIVAGAAGYAPDPDGTPFNSDDQFYAGRVYVFSGQGGRVLLTCDGENKGDQLGISVSGAGDVNLDGTPDIVAGAYRHISNPDGTRFNGDELLDAGRVYVNSGKDGTTLYSFDGENEGDSLGISVSGAGYVNLDGTPDIVVGAYRWDDPAQARWTTHGRVYVISGTPLPLTTDTHLMSVGAASVQKLSLDAGTANALKNYWIFTNLGDSGASPGVTVAPRVTIPLNPDFLTAFVGNLTHLGGGAPNLVGWKGFLNANGQASGHIQTLGPVPVLVGITVNHAALIYTAGACGIGCDTFQLATNAVPMTTVP